MSDLAADLKMAEAAEAEWRRRARKAEAERDRLREELARQIELRVEDEPAAVRRLSEERDRLREALTIAQEALDFVGDFKTLDRIAAVLAGSAPPLEEIP